MPEKPQTILVVDDEISDRDSIRQTLEGQGYTVLMAVDARSALQLFQRKREKVDMLLTDIALPGMNGCDLAKAILATSSALKVLFVSGHVGAEVCKLYGFPVEDIHFLRKPFSAGQLLDRVRLVLQNSDPLPLGSAA